MKVFVAMSGGVDSSTAAAVLKEGGHEVIGITMQLWPRQDRSDSGSKTSCCGLDAIEDARHVADHLDIPHYVLNFRDVFKHEIISPFVEEYLKQVDAILHQSDPLSLQQKEVLDRLISLCQKIETLPYKKP